MKVAALTLICLLLGGCGQSGQVITLSGTTMGTSYRVKVIDEKAGAGLAADINAELSRLDGIFSNYRDGTELSLFNALPVGEKMMPSADFRRVVTISREVHALTGGAFEVTLGPLVDLWGFGPSGPRSEIPEEAAITELLEQTGTDAIGMDDTFLWKTGQVRVDLSAVAKGYAVDRLADLLDAKGIGRYMIEVGGEVRARGLNDRHRPWMIAIEKPVAGAREIHAVIPLKDTGMATSGDYRNFFEREGRRYSHTLDPGTGWPVTHNLASVTVLHASSAFADALATAFIVLGAEETMRIADANHWRVLVIIRGDNLEARRSVAMDKYLLSMSSPGS